MIKGIQTLQRLREIGVAGVLSIDIEAQRPANEVEAKVAGAATTTRKGKGMAPKAPGLKTDLPKAKIDGPTPREKLESTRESKGTTKKKDVAEKAPRAEGTFLKETKGDSETGSKAAKSKSSDEPKAAKGDDKRPKTAPSAATSVFAAAGVEPKAAAGVVPPKLARDVSAEITSAVYSIEMTNAVQAAAGAAMEEANRIGLSGEQALRFYNAVQAAAIAVLDPSGDLLQGDEDEQSFKSTVETKLAIAIKKNAVRVMDLFRDWDENNDGVISKKEFRRALKNLNLGGTRPTTTRSSTSGMWTARARSITMSSTRRCAPASKDSRKRISRTTTSSRLPSVRESETTSQRRRRRRRR